MIDAWPSTLKLKQIKAVDTGIFFTGSVPSERDESKWVKFGMPIAIALITSFSVTSVVSLKKAIWPEQKLILVSPKQEGINAAWIGKRLEVDWYLQPEQFSLRNIAKDVSAVVSLTDQAGQPKQVTGKPPAIFDVSPGTYNLAVNVEGLPTLRMQVKVDSPSAEASSGPRK